MHERKENGTKPDWQLVIQPTDSLGPRGRRILFWSLAITSVTISGAFFLSGAWPVVGFMGLELLVLALAFRTMSGRQKHRETLELFANTLVVTKSDHTGQTRRVNLDADACHVSLPYPVRWSSALVLRQKPRYDRQAISVRLASFATPRDRADIADQLRTALKTH